MKKQATTGRETCTASCSVKNHAHCGSRQCCPHLYTQTGGRKTTTTTGRKAGAR
ncbi:hypothetical protein AB0H36_41590 [Kribbella sp. NPDC050820]|uniref:hypothetical protein n=1 Tax=Kribbella sp. NPDC050820 TaxID=3155408 RepID=UPI0033FB3F3B